MNMDKFNEARKAIADRKAKELAETERKRKRNYDASRQRANIALQNVLSCFGVDVKLSDFNADGEVILPFGGYEIPVSFVEWDGGKTGEITFDCTHDGTNKTQFVQCVLNISGSCLSFAYHMAEKDQFEEAIEIFESALQDAYN